MVDNYDLNASLGRVIVLAVRPRGDFCGYSRYPKSLGRTYEPGPGVSKKKLSIIRFDFILWLILSILESRVASHLIYF